MDVVDEQDAPKASKGRSKAQSKAAFSPPLTVSSADLLVAGKDDNFRQVIYLFVKVLGRLSMCREAFGRAIGLTGSQFAVLIGVAYRQGDEGVTVKELARYVQLAPTHVTTEVGRLSRKGLLDKRPGSEDRRSILVSLTAEGEESVKKVAPFVRKINDLLFVGVSAADLSAAHATFAKLSRNSEYAVAELKLAARNDRSKRSGA
ncbi:MarR family winged helix-turn-helix transcriptional regulator [Lichenifustis flavocetrariae]|uniref:MarR family transcriptional regulator n=1 Tax=Lichenifustis flavocetrariae TaxID=2949735 RepID=A0AA41Z209_9HYPH|nr:MarR family transcriptional regulator [Lichenifustis flavocetrariae]MCW6507827.1 MarR family transcriptional regulator [Lichenifustis flavocetrariae]